MELRNLAPRFPRAILGLTWREHIGGRWAVSLVGFAVVTPVALLAAFTDVSVVNAQQALQVAAISSVSLAVMGGVWLLAAVTVLRNRNERPAPIWLVVLLGVTSGAARSATVVLLAHQVSALDTPRQLWPLLAIRMAIGATQLGIGMPFLAMALSILNRYRSERSRLLEQQAELVKRQSEELGASRALRDALADPVLRRLRELADRLAEDSSTVRDVARDVRGQAHELWATSEASGSTIQVRFRQVFTASLGYQPLPIAAALFFWLPSAFLSLTGRESWQVGLVSSGAGTVVLLIVFMFGNWITRVRPSLGPLIFIVGTMIGGSLAVIAALWFTGGREIANEVPLMMTSAVRLASITLAMSLVEGAVRQSESVIQRLQEGIDAREVELCSQAQQRARLAKEVASVLHGVVQGRLAVAQRFPDDSAALARAALDEGIELLASTPVATSVRASELAGEIATPWAVLMDIDIDVDEGMIPTDRVGDVSDVLEECLSNAFRHGAASRVELKLRRQEKGWLISVSDNGSGIDQTAVAGLGTSLFEAVSGGDWSRELASSGGCVVKVRVNYSDQIGYRFVSFETSV